MARNLSMKDAINEALDLEMRRDPTVIVMVKTLPVAPVAKVKKTLGAVCSALPKA